MAPLVIKNDQYYVQVEEFANGKFQFAIVYVDKLGASKVLEETYTSDVVEIRRYLEHYKGWKVVRTELKESV